MLDECSTNARRTVHEQAESILRVEGARRWDNLRLLYLNGFTPIQTGPPLGDESTLRRHSISQSATLSLPSSVMNLRRLMSDIAFEDRLADQCEDGGEMCALL
jgi:hypothetical protein